MARPRVLLSWSSGKDGAWALHRLRAGGEVEVEGLLTTIDRDRGTVPMHGVAREIVRLQARAAGLALYEVEIPAPCPDDVWARAISAALGRARERGVTAVAFGDLFLEDVRAFRESRLAPTGLDALFPLWGEPTDLLAREMIDGGLEARIVCVDTERLAASFVGRSFDGTLVDDLPAAVDPCGERGEFHTVVTAGPMFDRAIGIEVGEGSGDGRFARIDVRPASAAPSLDVA
ncbi:MAG: ATP-binding protein [Thermoanaerobaculia bacterium]